MFAVLAHHLRAALVPLDVNFTFRTAFDWCVVLFILVERAGRKTETEVIVLLPRICLTFTFTMSDDDEIPFTIFDTAESL